MIQPGIKKDDFTCDGCGAKFYHAELPLLLSHKSLIIECPICHFRTQVRINCNSEVELLDSDYKYRDYYQNEKGLTYMKDEKGNFIPTPIDRGSK